ncbi:tetratricopeptide repeat protein, partial [archaeon]|nr:tetratricopeptide repeat protein [archaeon]
MILLFLAQADIAEELAIQEALKLPKPQAVQKLDSLYKATGKPAFLSAKLDVLSRMGELKKALAEAKAALKRYPSEPVFWEHLIR